MAGRWFHRRRRRASRGAGARTPGIQRARTQTGSSLEIRAPPAAFVVSGAGRAGPIENHSETLDGKAHSQAFHPKAHPETYAEAEAGHTETGTGRGWRQLDPKPKASPSEKPAGTPDTAKTESTTGAIKTSSASRTPGASPGNTPGAGTGTGNASSSGNAAGVGSGNGKGTAKSGSGSGTSEFGWYFSMIHDRFHSRWDQPSSLARGTQDIITTLKIRIGKDGSILSRDIVHSSGDTTMDESVMTAAERVQQIDPLPAGLGNGESYEINIAFKLDQSQ